MSKARESVAGAAAGPAALPDRRSRRLSILLATIVVSGLLIYAVCLFKHISYPLMWADESMTAVGAQRVLQYGYPKVHDGRNVFYDLRHSNPELGIEPKTDAYIGGAGWGHYYFAAPFVVLSKLATDFYHQTAILRIPFALAGFAGLLILLWVGIRSASGQLSRLAVAAIFVLLILPSITLQLHLREVRYYSLQLLLTAVGLSLFAAYHLRGAISFRTYLAAVTSLVPLLFLTFSPAALAFSLTVFLYLGGEWVVSRIKGAAADRAAPMVQLRSFLPVLAGLVLVAPLAWFFRALHVSHQLEEFYGFTLAAYFEHLGVIWSYFARYDILVFVIVAKLLLLLAWFSLRDDTALSPALKLSLLLTLYVIVHSLVVGKIPHQLFTRYFITLQPVLVLTFALDLLVLARLVLSMEARRRKAGTFCLALLVAGSLGWGYFSNFALIKGRLYEIRHQYQGVLDFVIPFLNQRFADPGRLTIATNYEETSYIYYLGSKVVVGFVNPDLEKELRRGFPERPDCIIYRKFWADPAKARIFEGLLQRDYYTEIRFPVEDYGFNNIPEAVQWTPQTSWRWGLHYFRTSVPDNPQRQVAIFLRTGSS